ncbi:TPA: hypothetical protein ACXDAZ_000517 [Clostridium botulinum]|uniref:hypothetical protein n=1 Tax=Clostridium botulinum TaxID=1491 RepID=UPI0008FC3C2A|nr:hypothetical protein [Clostridium botulinum]APC79862.1 hypothetical protein NPD2_661 [Clostridium botulinum]MCS4448319.1 hypothetical protein [Clostridium botulinum]MCS4459280.1 hypothetical protein [Clostridium botulinum]MCS4461805.1 hypothetical protein [Clostridium botulinum]MCS4512058.1 hypothetical protein [Clostridium botulinum]
MVKMTFEVGTIVVAVITGIITLIGVIINIILIKSQSKKQRTAEIITRNRVEWMQELKKYVSEYNSLVCYYYDKKIPDNLNDYFEKINNSTSKIKLHLNLKGIHDKKIKQIIEDLNSSLERFLQLTKYKETCNPNTNKKMHMPKELIEFYFNQYPNIGFKAHKEIFKEDKVYLMTEAELKQYLIDNKNNESTVMTRFISYVVKCIDEDLNKCVDKMKYSPKLIILLTQIYLKTEWERVKIEAEKGNKATFKFDKVYNEIIEQVQDEIDELERLINKKVR